MGVMDWVKIIFKLTKASCNVYFSALAYKTLIPLACDAFEAAEAALESNFPNASDLIDNQLPDHIWLPIFGTSLVIDLKAGSTWFNTNVAPAITDIIGTGVDIADVITISWDRMLGWLDKIPIRGSENLYYREYVGEQWINEPGTYWTPNKTITAKDVLQAYATYRAIVVIYKLLKRIGAIDAAKRFIKTAYNMFSGFLSRKSAERRAQTTRESISAAISSSSSSSSSSIQVIDDLVDDIIEDTDYIQKIFENAYSPQRGVLRL